MVRLTLFVTLSLVDLMLTGLVLRGGGGRIYESNPIAAAWINKYGMSGLVIFKVLVLFLISATSVMISAYSTRKAARVLTFGCIAVGAVVLFTCYLFVTIVRHQQQPRQPILVVVSPLGAEATSRRGR